MNALYAVEWEQWIKNPFDRQIKRKVNEADYVWEDEITGSVFAMPKARYDFFMKELQKRLSGLSGKERYEKVWNQTKIPFGSNDTAELAIHLPYPRPLTFQEYFKNLNNRKRTRLVDHVLIRAGLYYALYHPGKDEWNNIRKELLQVECGSAKEIDEFLLNGKWNGEPLRIDLVKAGAVKIKQYFLETNNIQEIRGASILLDEINQERIFYLCGEYWTPECVVYSGGGNILLVVPEGEGRKCCERIESLFRNVTISAQSVAEYITVSMEQLNQQYFSDVLSHLEMKKTERQMTILPLTKEWVDEGDINFYRPVKIKLNNEEYRKIDQATAIDNPHYRTKDNEQICPLCNKRIVTMFIARYKDASKHVCQSCFHKIVAGRNTRIFIDDMKEVLAKFKKKLPFAEFSENIEIMCKKTESEEIALIFGDGNNMGAFVKDLASFQAYRYFSYLTDSITKASVYTTLVEVIGDDISYEGKAQFEILSIGGDDVVLLVPAKFSLRAARVFLEKFDRAFVRYGEKEHEGDEEGMTLSIGICIGDKKTPFATLFKTASELLKNAKHFKKNNDDWIEGGTIDFMRLKSAVPYAGNLKAYRNKHYIRADEQYQFFQLLRPYTGEELGALEDTLMNLRQNIGNARNIILRLRDICESMTIREGKLYYLYYMYVLNKSNKGNERMLFQQHLSDFCNNFSRRGLEQQDLYFYDKKNKTYYSPFYDMAELWGFWG